MNRVIAVLIFLLLPLTVAADMTLMLGITLRYQFDVGLTLKVISNDKADQYVLAAGTSYYPFSSKKTGYDVGLGVTSNLNLIGLYGIDLKHDDAYMSIGVFH